MKGTVSRKRPGAIAILAAIALAALCYICWYSSQPWIGYETFCAANVGTFAVSAGYTTFTLAKIALPACIVGIAAFSYRALRRR